MEKLKIFKKKLNYFKLNFINNKIFFNKFNIKNIQKLPKTD